MRRLLLSTTALAGAVALAPAPAGAAQVLPGGALDINVGGEIRTIATYGDLDEAFLDDEVSTGLDFFNDTEVALTAQGKHERSGLEYGAVIQLEADTSVFENTDETWIFLRGGWGELHVGDDDGVSSFDAGIVAGDEGAALSAPNVAAGTGGLDGDIVADLFGVPTYQPLGTEDATKVSYATPKFSGLNVAVSYAPNLAEIADGAGNGDTLALKSVTAGDVVEAIARYDGEFEGFAVRASLSGLRGDIKDEDLAGGDDYWAAQAGALVEAFGVKFAGSYLTEEVGALEVDAVTFGVGAGFGGDDDGVGGFTVSFNYGQVIDSDNLVVNDNELGEPYTLVVSADYGLLPGVVLQGDVAYFDNDVEGGGGGDATVGDGKGWVGVAGIGLEF